MLTARGQENLAASHQHGAAIRHHRGQASRQLGTKTSGAKFSKTPMKVPLNDENAMTSKALKGAAKPSFLTPMAQRGRAVLGDKTTNAKAKGLQTVNVKSAVREIEQSQPKPQTTVRPKQKEIQAETQKLQVHAEVADLSSGDEIEYGPPKSKGLPYASNDFPDGVVTFDPLKAEGLLRGYYHHYFDSISKSGTSRRDRELQQQARRAIEEGERKIKEDLDNFEWSVKAELEHDAKVVKKAPTSTKLPAPRKPLSTVRSRNAASVLSMDDTTKSMQRKATKTPEPSKPMHKKASSFAMPGLRTSRPGSSQLSSIPKKSATGLEATSRTTIGYNKGRATASLLTKTQTSSQLHENMPTSASTSTRRGGIPRSNTTLSNDSDKTITPARYAHKEASGAVVDDDDDRAWKDRVPFLSIFNPDALPDEDDEDEDDPLCIKSKALVFPDDEEEEEFELKLVD